MSAHHFMLFDLYSGGHHGQYIRQLIEYWSAHRLPGRLDIVVPTSFLERHGDVQRATTATIRCVPITETIDLHPNSSRTLVHNSREHGRLLRKYVDKLRPHHCLCMYVDQLLLSLALGLRFSFRIQLSGIYFRPSFHYRTLTATPRKSRDLLRDLRKRLLLSAALRNRHFNHLFCLDPYVVPHLAQAVALPDGVVSRPPLITTPDMHAQWGVDANRRVALFFGSITARKGIHQTLEALQLLSPDTQKRLCIVLVGVINKAEKQRIDNSLRRIRQKTTVQVITDNRFVDEEEISSIMRAADLVLLPYQRHVGSSGVLVRAALQNVPVLGSVYGLVGEHIRRHKLGLPIDTSSPSVLAASLERWLLHPNRFPFDTEAAGRFAEKNTAEHFAGTIFRHLAPTTPPTNQTR